MSVLGKLGGRKFLMAIVGVLAIALQNFFGLDPSQVYSIGGVIVGFIITQGVTDSVTGGITSSSTPEVDMLEMEKVKLAQEQAKAAQIANAVKDAA